MPGCTTITGVGLYMGTPNPSTQLMYNGSGAHANTMCPPHPAPPPNAVRQQHCNTYSNTTLHNINNTTLQQYGAITNTCHCNIPPCVWFVCWVHTWVPRTYYIPNTSCNYIVLHISHHLINRINRKNRTTRRNPPNPPLSRRVRFFSVYSVFQIVGDM